MYCLEEWSELMLKNNLCFQQPISMEKIVVFHSLSHSVIYKENTKYGNIASGLVAEGWVANNHLEMSA